MYEHRGAKLAYVAHPRTASRATAAVLMAVGFVKVPKVNHHGGIEHRRSPTRGDRDRWTVFTTVRNHWSCARSYVALRAKGTGPLTVEVLTQALAPADHLLLDHEMFGLHKDVDRVLRYETLQADLLAICKEHGVGVPEKLPWIGETDEARRPYTVDGMLYVGRRFQDEVRKLDYGFEEEAVR